VVRSDPIHVDRLLGHSPKEIASSDDDSYLAAKRMHGCNLFGYFVDKDGIDSEAPAGRQSFS
jgi:hypothetical protein